MLKFEFCITKCLSLWYATNDNYSEGNHSGQSLSASDGNKRVALHWTFSRFLWCKSKLRSPFGFFKCRPYYGGKQFH